MIQLSLAIAAYFIHTSRQFTNPVDIIYNAIAILNIPNESRLKMLLILIQVNVDYNKK